MSLKAKIEAVIYACEEPVTLAQLVGLLGLEAEQELAVLAARQHTLHLLDSPAAAVAPAEPIVEPEVPAAEPEPVLNDEADPVVETAAVQETAAEKRVSKERDRKLRDYLRETVDTLIVEYATGDRGVEIREVAGGYRMGTKPEYHDAVRGFVKSLKPVLKLTLQALETLAVVSYKQPVTAPEISEIRGVDSGGVLGSLMARKLITTAGRKQVVGRPILYKTTKDFLLRFGLKDIGELPSIEEFEKMAGELAEQEEIPMSQTNEDRTSEERITHENLEEERHAREPQADGNSDDLNDADGPLSGLPPGDDKEGDDPPADEAHIQDEGRS